jgi:hypothetical protein
VLIVSRFTVILFGYQDERKKKERGALHLCDREGLGRVTSFLTRASGGVTPYCIRARKSGRLNEAVVKEVRLWRMMREGAGTEVKLWRMRSCDGGHLQEKGMTIGGWIGGKGQRTWSVSYVEKN